MRISILAPFIHLKHTLAEKLHSDKIIPSFYQSTSPIKDILTENAEVAILPLHECPILLPFGLVITALSERLDATYSLLLKKDKEDKNGILGIPAAAKIAVPSLLLKTRLAEFFPTSTIFVNENIIDQWKSEDFDAIVLPSFYLAFLATESYNINPLHQSEFVPKAGQGSFAFITRTDDLTTRRQLKLVHHSDSVKYTNIERKLQKHWEANHQIGAALCERDVLNFHHLYTQILDENGQVLSEKKSSSTLSSWFEI